jgi:hypothetical protein
MGVIRNKGRPCQWLDRSDRAYLGSQHRPLYTRFRWPHEYRSLSRYRQTGMGGIDGEDGVIRREKWPKRPVIVTGSRDHTLRVWLLPRPDEDEYRCFGNGEDEVDPAEV